MMPTDIRDVLARRKERKAKRAEKRKATGPNRATRLRRIKKELSALWSKSVRNRDGNRCLMCGKTEHLAGHHWRHRRGHSLALAFDIRNGATLCYGCHIGRLHRDGDGAFVLRFLSLMCDKIGAADCTDMDEIARHPRPVSLEELEEIRAAFLAPQPESRMEFCPSCQEMYDAAKDQYHRSSCADRNKP